MEKGVEIDEKTLEKGDMDIDLEKIDDEDEEDYTFEEFWKDKGGIPKKQMAYLAWCAISDLLRTEYRLDYILDYMEENFDPDWSTTDMKPVWEVHDALLYAYEHMEFDGEFEGEDRNEEEKRT